MTTTIHSSSTTTTTTATTPALVTPPLSGGTNSILDTTVATSNAVATTTATAAAAAAAQKKGNNNNNDNVNNRKDNDTMMFANKNKDPEMRMMMAETMTAVVNENDNNNNTITSEPVIQSILSSTRNATMTTSAMEPAVRGTGNNTIPANTDNNNDHGNDEQDDDDVVIELLDDENDNDDDDDPVVVGGGPANKRLKLDNNNNNNNADVVTFLARQQQQQQGGGDGGGCPAAAAAAGVGTSHDGSSNSQQYQQHLQQQQQQQMKPPPHPSQQQLTPLPSNINNGVPPTQLPPAQQLQQQQRVPTTFGPVYIPFAQGFRPTWRDMVPVVKRSNHGSGIVMPDAHGSLQPLPSYIQHQHHTPPGMGLGPTAGGYGNPPGAAGSSSSYGRTPMMMSFNDQPKSYQLTLLNVNEFTIKGLSPGWGLPPSSIAKLRVPIKQISREHGKAVYERIDNKTNNNNTDDGNSTTTTTAPGGVMTTTTATTTMDGVGVGGAGEGKWRIPLGAYQTLLTYLINLPNTAVDGIPDKQLKIATIERNRQEKGYPSAEKLIKDGGVPQGLARALAPFQRGGVDFVLSRNGRALIADDMGCGKTIQGVASMSAYHKDWPVLVLTPSSARFHWENEFRNWLGINSLVNKVSEEDDDEIKKRKIEELKQGMLLRDTQIHVLSSGKDAVLPTKSTKVVICSYGLVASLVNSGRIYPTLFKCAIVDESHMLKNKTSKRTAALLPILQATDRCVLLSGTPALAKPEELWPQLQMVQGEHEELFWGSEDEFTEKYVRKGGPEKLAELHTMLTGTVMIRRLKSDVLKALPRKVREKASFNILDKKQRDEFKQLLRELRKSRGVLGKIAKNQYWDRSREGMLDPQEEEDENENEQIKEAGDDGRSQSTRRGLATISTAGVNGPSPVVAKQVSDAQDALEKEIDEKLASGRDRIQQNINEISSLPPDKRNEVQYRLENDLLEGLDVYRQQKLAEIGTKYSVALTQNQQGDDSDSKRPLQRLFALTGDAKVPLIVDMVNRWFSDPTKGKLCLFAHHLSVLDSIQKLAGLSSSKGGRKFIRIDGATTPAFRQQQINSFQSDPSIRIALLGITAAGVAVTLTASSTVWFAELFWTPAILIQAEDRCHRIGQQAAVKALYFVARGTLDDVLWGLLEKKFRALGEFVEGKEKQKIVVNKSYNSVKDLHGMFSNSDLVVSGCPATGDDDSLIDDDGVDAASVGGGGSSGGASAGVGGVGVGLDEFSSLLMDDIAEMGEKEQMKMRAVPEDDDNEANTDSQSSRVVEARTKTPTDNDSDDDERKQQKKQRQDEEVVDESQEQEEEALGQSEEAAITLIDDDDDDEVDVAGGNGSGETATTTSTAVPQTATLPAAEPVSALQKPTDMSPMSENSRLYKLVLNSDKLGVSIMCHYGRIVVMSPGKDGMKPAVGDIIVTVNGYVVPLVGQLEDILPMVRKCFERPPVELVLLEDPYFIDGFNVVLSDRIRKRLELKRQNRLLLLQQTNNNNNNNNQDEQQQQPLPPPNADSVIDLIED